MDLILLEGSEIELRHYLDRQNVSMKTSDNFYIDTSIFICNTI